MLYQYLSIYILKNLILQVFNILLRPLWSKSDIRKYGAQRESHAKHSPIKKHIALSGQLLIYLASIARRPACPFGSELRVEDRQAGFAGQKIISQPRLAVFGETGSRYLTLFVNKNKGGNLKLDNAVTIA